MQSNAHVEAPEISDLVVAEDPQTLARLPVRRVIATSAVVLLGQWLDRRARRLQRYYQRGIFYDARVLQGDPRTVLAQRSSMFVGLELLTGDAFIARL